MSEPEQRRSGSLGLLAVPELRGSIRGSRDLSVPRFEAYGRPTMARVGPRSSGIPQGPGLGSQSLRTRLRDATTRPARAIRSRARTNSARTPSRTVRPARITALACGKHMPGSATLSLARD